MDDMKKPMDAAEKAAREEAAEMKTQKKTEAAYNAASKTPPARSKTGSDAGESGKKWNDMFPK